MMAEASWKAYRDVKEKDKQKATMSRRRKVIKQLICYGQKNGLDMTFGNRPFQNQELQ